AAGTTLLVASWPVALAGLMALPDHLAVFAPEYGGGIGLVLERNRPFELRGRTYYCSLDGVRQLRELRELVAKIPDGASLFISPNPPSLNFVSGHRNPTRYVRVDESAPDAVRAAMEEVAGGAGNWLLLQTDFVFDVAPQARRVLAEQFSHEGDQGKFTLWRRRQGKRGEGDGEEVEP
ncbi:MAG TPA: hypothetical protein PKA64_11290, partial [Myxococcota bacterium]|nr:hypothetical protein [Myxococcota bacterium]